MDIVNTKIGQNLAREAASAINEKSFTSANLVGFQSGASAFSAGENQSALQQVRYVDKAIAELPQNKNSEEKKLKANIQGVDNLVREERNEISSALDSISEFLGTRGTNLAFSIDDSTSRQIVTVMDRETGDIIRQIPSEEVLNFAAKLQELTASDSDNIGLFIDGRA